MGAADLHDAIEVLRLLRQCAAQLRNGGQQFVGQRFDGGHMHGGGEHVVARLAAVHVIVRVHQTAFTPLATEDFAGAVGQHFVDVHVGLGARAGLPDHEREFTRVFARNDLVRRVGNGLGLLGVLQAQGLVDHGRRTFHLGQRLDDFARLLFTGDVEVLQGALRLCAPQLVGRDLYRAEGVAFGAGGAGVWGGHGAVRLETISNDNNSQQ